MAAAKDEDLLLSVHLKATMMKVSDPIIFGHAVRAALPGVFSTYGRVLAEAGLRAEDGLASILAGLDSLPQGEEIRAAIEAELAGGPACPWWTPTAASRTCTCPVTSSSTPPCPP